jgi:hypothetical protein
MTLDDRDPHSPDPHFGLPPHPAARSAYPPRTSSTGGGMGPSISPGQVMSSGPGQPPASGPGQIVAPGPGHIMPPGPDHPISPGPRQVMPVESFGPGQVMNAPPMLAPRPVAGQIVPPSRGSSQRAASVGPTQGHMAAPYSPGVMSRGPSPFNGSGSRRSSDRSSGGVSLRKSSSSHSLGADYDRRQHPPGAVPPMPGVPDGLAPPNRPFVTRSGSSSSLSSLSKPLLPSAQFSIKSISTTSFADPSPPSSPVEETAPSLGPITSRVTCDKKCKVFLQEHHAKWKNLGSAKLKLYHESPTNVKQLVVEADSSKKSILISTIVLVDGVERVGKTGVAVELSDKGRRTGIIYMIQTKNERDANDLFKSLLAGSDRSQVNA